MYRLLAADRLVILTLIAMGLSLSNTAHSADPYEPTISPASPDGELAIRGFQIPEGMKASLVAAEPMLANPVAFCIDERGRFYVCETFRQQKGVEDNRNHGHWLHDDLAAQTVQDRIRYFKKHLGEKVAEYTLEHDRIRLLEDTDGDGQVDSATVFADGFNAIEDGTGAGVLSRNGNVYYTCIPKLYLLRDKDGDGRADEMRVLHDGFGVRVAFRGHDMHGLIVGPDGRLYFSIGDRGFNVTTPEGKHLAVPETGAVFRCELDGSNLELYAYGLRNPQELAFDDFGNLFTVDNNSDSGDQARLVYIAPGSDSGWRMYYQYLQDRGPWNREMIWYPRDAPPLERQGPGNVPAGSVAAERQPAYTLPPLANISDGPSGLVFYPGVGLSEKYRGHFFLADFRGTPANSGIRAFSVTPNGAGFELANSEEFLWRILATDVDFGYDGAIYLTDWVAGWEGPGKGRIYRFADPAHSDGVDSAELMANGFKDLRFDDLTSLLEHADRRIRLEAQFELVRRGEWSGLAEVAYSKKPLVTRLHAIWGLGQLTRTGNTRATNRLSNLMYRQDDEILAQAAKTFSESLNLEDHSDRNIHCLQVGGCSRLVKLLSHDNPRVRFFAALGLARIGRGHEYPKLIAVLEQNQDKDVFLRHAVVMALAGLGEREPAKLLQYAEHSSRFVRFGVLLALRRLERPEIKQFLNDVEPDHVLEAARAINDLPIDSLTDELAVLADRPGLSDPLLRRVLNANYRLGGRDHAEAVARIAAQQNVPDAIRLEAINELSEWKEPSPLDRVTGAWRPIGDVAETKPVSTSAVDPATGRDISFMAEVLRPKLGGLLTGSNRIREEAVKLASQYGIREVGPKLFELLTNTDHPESVRVAAMAGLDGLNDDRLDDAIEIALADSQPLVRAEAQRILAKRDPNRAVGVLADAIESGATRERQQAIRTLAELNRDDADSVLGDWMSRLNTGEAPAEIWLDLLEAAKQRGTNNFQVQLDRFEKSRSAEDHLAQFRESLEGGDAERGKDIFFGRSEVSCRRCHKIDDSGGEVGPELSKIGREKNREYLLESLVAPSKQIAKGYQTVVIATIEGLVYVGVLKEETDEHLRLMTAEGSIITVAKDSIDDRAEGKSAMPEDLIKLLSKSDIRDLVEFLSTLKGEGNVGDVEPETES